jgi:uncharacterized damage-inducible protein DinB
MSVESLFLEFSTGKLRQLTCRIDTCLGKLNEDQIWARGHENQNAIGNLVLHLAGNVNQWILESFGSVPLRRDRDGEFAARGGFTGAQLTTKLNAIVERATAIVANLTTEQLTATYTIQNYPVTGVDAVYHVVEHFAQHTAQIIFATKMLTSDDLGFYRHLSNAAPAKDLP